MKKRFKCQLPCVYCFEKYCSENEAVALVQSHVNDFHQDLLPFGITNNEALTLLEIEREYKSKTQAFHGPTAEPFMIVKRATSENKRARRKGVQAVASPFS